MLLYGEPRLTRDIDITLGVDTDWLARILQAMAPIGLTTIVDDVRGFVQRMCLPFTMQRAEFGWI